MLAEVIDYRVSRIVILCKDCGQDVGLYPARHKCDIPTLEAIPALPAIPKKFQPPSTNSSETNSFSSSKFKSYNLWNKLMSNAADIYNNAGGDSDNESEKDDWDGETHISRILREYYEGKGGDLPNWLYDSNSNPNTSNKSFMPQTDHTFIKRQVPMNGDKNVVEVNNNRSRQPIPRNNNSMSNSFPIANHSSTRMEGGRYRNAPPPPNSFNGINNNNPRNVQYHNNIPPLPVSRRLIDHRINNNFGQNSLPPRNYQPVSNSDDNYNVTKRLVPSRTSYQINSRGRQDPSQTRKSSSVRRDIKIGVGFNEYNGHNEHNEHKGYKDGGLRSGKDS
ncbi:512_t:CDS:2, partial [Funneliformis caledonium]